MEVFRRAGHAMMGEQEHERFRASSHFLLEPCDRLFLQRSFIRSDTVYAIFPDIGIEQQQSYADRPFLPAKRAIEHAADNRTCRITELLD